MKYFKLFIKRLLYISPIIGRYYKLKSCGMSGLSFSRYLKFRLMKKKNNIYWPKENDNVVANIKNIKLGVNCSIGNHGCYIQGSGKLTLGNYVRVAMNVGIMSGNHALEDHSKNVMCITKIGDYSWIGMNSVILPGVELGERTVVAAGSVVTKSFDEGYCVIGGNPARIIKKIDNKTFIPPLSEHEFIGYVPIDKFDRYRRQFLTD